MEIGHLNQLQVLYLANNSLSGPISSKLLNISTLEFVSLEQNFLSGMLPSNMGFGLPNLQALDIYGNNFVGKLPDSISNASNLVQLDLSENEFSGIIPNSFGDLRVLEVLFMESNNLTLNDDSLEIDFLTSLASCKYLAYLVVSENWLLSKLRMSIGNLSNLEQFFADSLRIKGNIPLEIGNMSNLIRLSLSQNDLNGPIPSTIKGLHKLQSLNLDYNGLQGSIVHEICEIRSLSELNLTNNKLFGEIPTCLGNMTLLRKFHIGSNRLTSKIPSSFWNLKDILEVSISSNALIGNLPPEIQNLRALGGFGSVYQGILSSGKMVAIKVLDLTLEATSRSFDAECNAMRNLRHRNIVHVISSCSNDDFKSLVMEFMPNGSLEKWLYSENYCLDFLQRLNIMIDVASALEYLHHGSSIPVVHCDLKPSNVLLDEYMVAHVSDFGISKLLDEGQSKTHTETLATLGYVAPEYGSKGVISIKGDVYSYGIMLMEMFTRKKPTNEMFSEELTLKTWISKSMVNSVMEVVDYNLVSQHEKELHEILALALSCCADSPEARIEMTDVTVSLIKIKTLVMRYPDDIFDRIWTPAVGILLSEVKSEESRFDITTAEDHPPEAALQNAIVSSSTLEYIQFINRLPTEEHPVYINAYFSEVMESAFGKRSIQMNIDGMPFLSPIVPPLGSVKEVYITNISASANTTFILQASYSSTFPPILNALEVFTISDSFNAGTDSRDGKSLRLCLDK
ncbi:hypothetical protein TSUD_295450 [Trifolium subterraneum]|uniref:non-specific serine/threonine protein kinase n=1 Tax=Trifolium subterraneum TaxID=3900 RepID=A0A2Z6NRL4_TRISU|nr:hypothetical protein TSUD_295450 [Trifolium subterraneum]